MRARTATVKTLRAEHADATRLRLLEEARVMFGKRGYGDTSLDDVARAAQATKGAVYHHFRDKKELFQAVYELLSRELVEAVIRRAGANPAGRIDRALAAFLEETTRPERIRVLLQDGPAVLQGACREIDARYGLGLVRELVEQSAEPKLLEEVGAEVMAKLVLAVVIEAGLVIGASGDRKADARRRVQRMLKHVFDGLTAGRRQT